MANYTDSITRIRNLCANHSEFTTTVAGQFYNTRHRHLLESYNWSRKKQEVLIVLIAQESSGTFAITDGSSTATITGGSLGSGDVGKAIRFNGEDAYFMVKSVSSNDVTLGDQNGSTVAYQGTTDADATYVMFKRYYSLGTAIEQILTVRFESNKLESRPLEWLDEIDPKRNETGDPVVYVIGPRDLSGTNDLVQIELYPRPTAAGILPVTVLKGHTDLSGTSNPIVPSGPLEWGAAIDGSYFLFAKTGDEHWIALAKKYDDEYEKSLERELVLDGKKFGLSDFVKDVGGGHPLAGTDYGVDHDVDF